MQKLDRLDEKVEHVGKEVVEIKIDLVRLESEIKGDMKSLESQIKAQVLNLKILTIRTKSCIGTADTK
jgi:archaellum component FlaC